MGNKRLALIVSAQDVASRFSGETFGLDPSELAPPRAGSGVAIAQGRVIGGWKPTSNAPHYGAKQAAKAAARLAKGVKS